MQVLVTEEIELIEHDNLVGFLLVVGTQKENTLAVEQEGEHVFDANTSFSEQGHHVGSSTHRQRQHEHVEQHGKHDQRRGNMGAVPLNAALQYEANCSDCSSNDNYGMQTDDASTEETAHCQSLLPTVVVGIADDRCRSLTYR